MMTQKERAAMQQALEALKLARGSHGVMLMSNPPHDAWQYRGCDYKLAEAITALREALDQDIDCPCGSECIKCSPRVLLAEQAEQEPVAWALTSENGEVLDCISHTYKVTQPCTVDYDEPLYAAQKTTVWKAIDGYEEQYEVSDEGDIRNKKTGKVLAKSLMGDGYVKADLWKNGERWQTSVHRIVAAAFIDNPENLPEVNHINGIKTDNRTSNLEWTTRVDNVNHSYYELGNQVNPIVATNIVTDERVEYPSVEAAVRAGFNSGSIYRCLSGKYKSTNGWRFEKQPAPVRTKDLTDDEIMKINVDTASIVPTCDRQFHFARAVIAADRSKNGII